MHQHSTGSDNHSMFRQSSYYRTCGSKCVSQYRQCEGSCPSGLTPCGSYNCLQVGHTTPPLATWVMLLSLELDIWQLLHLWGWLLLRHRIQQILQDTVCWLLFEQVGIMYRRKSCKTVLNLWNTHYIDTVIIMRTWKKLKCYNSRRVFHHWTLGEIASCSRDGQFT